MTDNNAQTITASRLDYVLQPDGTSWAWAVEVRVSLVDQFAEGGTQTVTYGPMSPQDAEGKFGIALSDIIAGINDRAASDLALALAGLDEARAALLEETKNRISSEDDVANADKTIKTLRDAFKVEQDSHEATRAQLAEVQRQITALRDAMIIRAQPVANV
jgi:hypothetical protein